MIPLLEIEQVSQILGYRDLRSVRNWLAGKGIPILKLGKGEYADREIFEKTIAGLIERKRNDKKGNTRNDRYKLQSATEKMFVQDLHSFLNRANVGSDEN